MEIMQGVHIEKRRLNFAAPFTIAYETVDHADVIMVRLTAHNGQIGWGSAAPDTEVTGETVEGVEEILREKLMPSFFDASPESWYYYHQKIQKAFAGFPSAEAAVEMAVLNLWSVETGIPLHLFFGGYRTSCKISVTIGITSIEETLNEAEKILRDGFRVIKLKGGHNIEEDKEKIMRLDPLISKNQAQLILDPNQGYNFESAVRLLKKLPDDVLALVEQPLPAEDHEGLNVLGKEVKVPIIADEAAVSPNNVLALLELPGIAGVNIKLMKCGGPINFLKIFHAAQMLGKLTMIGCMYESQISITMGAHLALGLPIDYVDLDSGRFDFPDEGVEGGADISHGILTIQK